MAGKRKDHRFIMAELSDKEFIDLTAVSRLYTLVAGIYAVRSGVRSPPAW